MVFWAICVYDGQQETSVVVLALQTYKRMALLALKNGTILHYIIL